MMRENNSDNPHAVFYTLPSPKQMRTGTMTAIKVRQDCLPILIRMRRPFPTAGGLGIARHIAHNSPPAKRHNRREMSRELPAAGRLVILTAPPEPLPPCTSPSCNLTSCPT